MISLYMPQNQQIWLVAQKLTDELGAATNIKSRENRQSVQSALRSILVRLKLYKNVPENGLVIFAGEVLDPDDNKEKKVMMDFEPFKPVTVSRYLCDNRFHTDILMKALNLNEKTYGFIIVDGKGFLMATLEGNVKTVLTKQSVDLPPKHGRGGQSSNRFANIRTEKRHNYMRKVAESATECFISDNRCNVSGLVIGGSADLKVEMAESGLFDPRLYACILKYVDLSYGGEMGLNQAIELAADCLKDSKLIQERNLLIQFFDSIATGLIEFLAIYTIIR